MIIGHHRLIAFCFCSFLSWQTLAVAPVVDESENFAILDEQQAAVEQQPVAKNKFDNTADEEIPLVQDDVNIGNDNGQILDKLQSMRQEIQELRGALEVQSHELKLLQQQQLAFYKDLDNRLRKTSQTPPAQIAVGATDDSLSASTKTDQAITAPPSQQPFSDATTVPTHVNPAEEQISYMAAYELVKNKHFDEALSAMQKFVGQYPQGGYTANAQYWLGELYMVKRNYPQAIEHFEVVLKQFPTSSKAAACTLKIGYALAASGKENDARQRLQQVLKNYPDTPTAQLATAKLKSLNAL